MAIKYLALSIAILTGHSLAVEQEIPHTFEEGQPGKASEVNENFTALNSRISAVTSPEDSYSIISSEPLDNGLVRTKLYAYEVSNYSSRSRYDASNTNLYLNDGDEYIVNALGEFQGEWSYIGDYSKTNPEEKSASPIACYDGSAMVQQDYDIVYSLIWRNQQGAFAFSNRGTENAGIYSCPESDFTSDAGKTSTLLEYYYLEGKGVGIYSCAEKVVWHGAFLDFGDSSWEKMYVPERTVYPNSVTGVFDRSNNGLWGTYYLEIDAPAGCLNL